MDVRELEGPIAVIGGGVMGETMVSGLVRAGVASHRMRVADASATRCEELQQRYGVATAETNADACFEARIVLLVVKPHIVAPVLAEIATVLEPGALVVSLAAGISLASLESALKPGTPVVRVMPNTPARIGAGMAAISPGRHAGSHQIAVVKAMMDAVGASVVIEERLQDAATACSGSGPAYVFLVAEAMVDAGVQLGLTRDVATQLVNATLRGSAELLATSGTHPAVLRNQVTSPGGTTAAALAVLETHGIRAAFSAAMGACAARSAELGA